MSRTRTLTLFLLALLSAFPLTVAVHAEPAPGEEVPADASALCAEAVLSTPPALWMLPEVGAQSTCIAQCWDGSTRTCTGSSCTAYDSACPDEQGRCFGSDPLHHKKCPPCSDPCPEPSCEDLDGTYCKYNGSTTTCYFQGSSCSAATCNCSASGGSGSWICP